MFMSYEVLATFGISAVLSFSLSALILLVIAAKRGYLRVGATRSLTKVVSHASAEKGQMGAPGSPLLVTPSAPPAPLPMYVELAPLKEYSH